MARYYTTIFIATMVFLLFFTMKTSADNLEDFEKLAVENLRLKRARCEIRDPFTGGCAVPGPRSPFKRDLNSEMRGFEKTHERGKRAPCEIRDPFTGGCAVPGPRSPFK